MYKKVVVSLVFVSVLTLSLLSDISVPFKTSVLAASEIPNLDHMIVATVGEPDTVDPAWAYDTASCELIFNVYEPLIFFNKTEVDEFVPALATEWTVGPDGLRYTFKIREGVKFHNGEILTTEDVEYSFERAMVMGSAYGPAWMLYEPLLNRYYADMDWPENETCPINTAVESNSTHVWFNLVQPYTPFLSSLATSWGSSFIVNKGFCIEHGCWPGTWTDWKSYHDPDVSPLMDPDPVMCGTGAYRFHNWTIGVEWNLEYFADYWKGWPADGCDDYVETVTEKFVSNWETRKMMFLSGDCDFCYVPGTNIYGVLGQPGITCVDNLPSLIAVGNFYNFEIASSSRYLKPPFSEELPPAPGGLNDTGIPANFFNDTHLRKGFSYSVNYTELLEVGYLGEAIYSATPAIEGLPYRRPPEWYEANQYNLNLTRAEYEFKMAWGGVDNAPGQYDPAQVTPGALWTNGFKLTITYNYGNVLRETLAKTWEANIESINPAKFHIETLAVDWRTIYVPELGNRELTMFTIGWIADYPDPHNFFHPFMHSTGAFAYWQSYSNPYVDDLIEEGLHEANETRRQEIYYELQEIYIRDAPSVCTYQPTVRHWERDWVQGWYYNPIYPDGYFYHYWKALAPEYPSAQSVDVSVDSITDVDGTIIKVQEELMWPTVPINITVTRLDSNTNVSSVDVIIGITRTNNETGEYVVIDTQMTSLGIDGSFVAEFLWNETGLEPGYYTVGGVVGVVSGYAYDVNAANSAISDGQVTVTWAQIPNPDHLIVATIGEPDTVDPAWAYDTASCELIFNVYEPLIRFNRTKVDEFVQCLATECTVSPDGLRYTFKIRDDVMFHNGEILTTEDVEYSFERAMVMDHAHGPMWMLYEPLLNRYYADMDWPENETCPINTAVESNSTHVWFNLVQPYTPFLSILAQSWGSIVNKAFCVEHGCWPGTWNNWTLYHDPAVSPLDTGGDWMCGTGPYKFDYWTREVEYSLVKFDGYWQGWPAPDSDGYVTRVTVKKIPEWIERKEMFLNGTADIVYVPRQNIEEVEGQPGIRCLKNLPTLVCSCIFFTFDINTTSPYMGVPGGLPPGTFNETGIPPDFFNDTDIRKGFAYSFNYTSFIEDTYQGEANQPSSPVIDGLPYHNPDNPKYAIDLAKAEEHFRTAWGGQVWDEGFNFTITYNTGNVLRETIAYMLKTNVESLNPKFHIEVVEVDWPIYVKDLFNHSMPMFYIGWLADYPDPHNFVFPFMHTDGDFNYFAGYSNSTVDNLIDMGMVTPNGPERQGIYYTLQLMYYQDVPSLALVQPLGRHWERDWVQGWYHNPMYPGGYFYHYWKELVPEHDIAITNVTPSKTIVAQGYSLFINVTVKNQGNYAETFNVTTYYDTTAIGTKLVTSLAPYAETTLTFSWDTTGVAGGYYTISAQASTLPGETNTEDNTLIDGTVKVTSPVRIAEVIPCNQTGDPKDTFELGTMAYFRVTINSTALIPQDTLITINLYDNASVTIGVASFQGPITPGVSVFIFGLPISTSASTGIAAVYANAYTDWPHLGGVPHCPEMSATFEIIGP